MEKSKAEKIELIEQANQIKRELEADITEKCDVPLDLIINKLGLKNQNDNEASKKDLYISLNRKLRAMEKDFEFNFLFWRKTKYENYDAYKRNQRGIQKEMINIFFVRNMIREWFAGADKQTEFSEQLQKLNKKNTDLDTNIFSETIDTNNDQKIIFKNFGLYDDMDFNGLIGYVPGYFEDSGEYCEGYLKIYTKELNNFEKIFEHEWQEFRVPLVGSINFSSNINGFQDPNEVKFGNNCFFDALIILLAKQPLLHIYCMRLADKIFEPGKFNLISNSRDMFHVLKNDKIYKEMNEKYPLMIALIDYIKALHDAEKRGCKSIAPFYFRNQLAKLDTDFENGRQCEAAETFNIIGRCVIDFFSVEEFELNDEMRKMCDVNYDRIHMDICSIIFDLKTPDMYNNVVHKFFCSFVGETSNITVAWRNFLSGSTCYLEKTRLFKSSYTDNLTTSTTLADICLYHVSDIHYDRNDNLWLKNKGKTIPFNVHQPFECLYLPRSYNDRNTSINFDFVLPSLVKTGNNYNDYFMLSGTTVSILPSNHVICIIRCEDNIFYRINDLESEEKKVMKVDSSVLEKDTDVRFYSDLVLYRRINRNIFEIEKAKGATYEDITNAKTFDFSKIFLPLFLHGSFDGLKKIMCEIGVIAEEKKLLNHNSLTPDNIVGSQGPKDDDKNKFENDSKTHGEKRFLAENKKLFYKDTVKLKHKNNRNNNYDKLDEYIINDYKWVQLDINNGDEIQNIKKQEINASENEIKDKNIELEKNYELTQNIISSKQMEDVYQAEDIKNVKGEYTEQKNITKIIDSIIEATPLTGITEEQKKSKSKNKTVNKRGFFRFLKNVFIWLGKKIKSGFVSIKNFMVSLVFRNISKDQLNKTLNVNQNDIKSAGNNNSKKTKVPETTKYKTIAR